MSILQTSDFTSQYKVSKDCFTDLQSYIDKYEKHYLLRLLGADLYGLFIADLTVPTPQVPQTAIYISLFDAFEIDDDNDCLRISEGIKVMLTQFVYFQFLRDQPNKKKIGGVYRTEIETGTNLGYDGYNLVEAYNQGVKNYKEIQWFICDNDTDYPTENSQPIEYTSGI
jgi:hypothetical protein